MRLRVCFGIELLVMSNRARRLSDALMPFDFVFRFDVVLIAHVGPLLFMLRGYMTLPRRFSVVRFFVDFLVEFLWSDCNAVWPPWVNPCR
jgi:hypothetical protein